LEPVRRRLSKQRRRISDELFRPSPARRWRVGRGAHTLTPMPAAGEAPASEEDDGLQRTSHDDASRVSTALGGHVVWLCP
jgi:hypothetical protein